MSSYNVPAGEFKSKCLSLMDEVNKSNVSIVITKRGRPVAKLTPIKKKKFTLFGCLKGSAVINSDIIKPITDNWDAENDK
jgi:prevent-host-death family protein